MFHRSKTAIVQKRICSDLPLFRICVRSLSTTLGGKAWKRLNRYVRSVTTKKSWALRAFPTSHPNWIESSPVSKDRYSLSTFHRACQGRHPYPFWKRLLSNFCVSNQKYAAVYRKAIARNISKQYNADAG